VEEEIPPMPFFNLSNSRMKLKQKLRDKMRKDFLGEIEG